MKGRRAIELVQRVAALGSTMRKEGGAGLASRATVRVLQMTAEIARRMRALAEQSAIPRPGPAERVALSAAAAQLRAIAEGSLVAVVDDPRGAALADLVGETLALVDAMLAEDPALPREERAPPALPEVDDGKPRKVRF